MRPIARTFIPGLKAKVGCKKNDCVFQKKNENYIKKGDFGTEIFNF